MEKNEFENLVKKDYKCFASKLGLTYIGLFKTFFVSIIKVVAMPVLIAAATILCLIGFILGTLCIKSFIVSDDPLEERCKTYDEFKEKIKKISIFES